MSIEKRLQEIGTLPEQELRELAEAVREQAERLVRSDPSRLPPLLAALREAAQARKQFLPWAWWIEGMTEQGQGRPATATPLLRQASQWFRRHGDQHTAARIDLPLMDAVACLGRHREARQIGRRALEVFSTAGDRPRMASALINLGGLADIRDQVREALSAWQKARRTLAEGDRLRQGLIEISMGGAWQALGRFRRSAAMYTHAATLLAEEGAAALALQPRLGLAEMRALLGEVGQALTEIQEIEVQAERYGNLTILFEARLLLARIELDLGHLHRTATIAAANQPACVQEGRFDDAARFAALKALALVQGSEPEADQAVAEAEQALHEAGLNLAAAVLRVELAGLGRPVPVAQLLSDASRLDRAGMAVQADLARLRSAEVLVKDDAGRAARLCRQVSRRRHVSVWPRIEAHRLLAETLVAQDAPAAIRHLRSAVRLAESTRGRLSSENDRAAVTARAAAVYERLVELLLRRGDARARRQAFDLVARVKSRSLLEALDRRRDLEWVGNPELVHRWNAIRQELAAMLATIEGKRGEHARYSAAVVERRIRQLSVRMEDVELELARAVPGLGLALGRDPEARLRSALGPGERYLELFFAGDDLVVFDLDRSGMRVLTHSRAREQVEERIGAVRFQLSKATFGRRCLEVAGAFLTNQVRSHLSYLGELVLATLADRPAPKQLLVAPHGLLHHLPLAALELGGEPLLCHCPVAVAPGSAILGRLLRRPQQRPRQLGIAGSAPNGLPEIDREVTEIASRFANARVVQGATSDHVRNLLTTCDAVHVASHGAFQPLFPAGSGIRLEDQWLTALDLLQLPIRARLVSLSACASGQVAVTPGEELIGVVRALFAAGAQTAILAPGALDDTVARQGALLLYDRMLSDGPGAALRHALLCLRDEHPHPALWAALQLYGNPRPWEDQT
jgi:tetratricopeptide (TPR) repeat protein